VFARPARIAASSALIPVADPARRDARSPVVNDPTGFAGPEGTERPLSIDAKKKELLAKL